ncbi:hypothetical protein [[Mycobacterium] burgundiense]|uniref:Uncharacterized protein n=1 Tax=[Mycobacterium] burgundiense TaxID=3064286 RepID=A0ABM9L9B0_9MYCO|nr:hypothetical protein [Mycolicibacterium sp. MU0053]CAJ1495098.1 hypothetical protein MU0053_000269 [Mycolicibacterium sp. MU0053]
MAGMVEIEMRFFASDGDRDPVRFEHFLDAVVDEFAKQGFDVDYSAVASALEATFTIDVSDGSEGALIAGLTALQTALAAVGVDADIAGGHEVLSTRKLALA